MPNRRRFCHALLLCACAAIGFSACGKEAPESKESKAESAARTEQKEKAKKEKPELPAPYGQDPDDYVLTFSEEFNRFNEELWNDYIWYEKPNPTKNYAVEDGKLKIWPQRDPKGKFFNRTIDTDGNYYQTYGYFEMEAKLPRGKGTWPAFWLFNHIDERRPEIDIMEAYAGGIDPWGYTDGNGVARPKAIGVTVWYDEGVKAGSLQYDTRRDLSSDFHKYAVKWEPDRLTFYFDGKQVHQVRARMPDRKYIVLDLWFGSDSGEPDESTPEGKRNSFEVKYVRAWQFKRLKFD